METYISNNEYLLDVFIEISKNSHIKYEYDKNKKALVCDRILRTPFKYFFNYGFIPETLSEDGDPIDAVIIMDDELIPGSYIKCKLVGSLETCDDEGNDPKLILYPCNKVDPKYYNINDINDVNKIILEKIEFFFQQYKVLENKKVTVGNFLDKNSSIKIYEDSITRYNSNK
jgi:inorganic pyrophosphatase